MKTQTLEVSAKPAILGGKPSFDALMPITKPTVPPVQDVLDGYRTILESGMLTNGRFVREFEEKVAGHLGVKQAVAIHSCTSGLMLVMRILGLKGEVIMPAFTFHATAHAAIWNGLTPVFVDCDPLTYNIDLKSIEKAITPRTSAIVGVHMFGNPCPVKELEALARKRGLKLIFDAAHGFGARHQGRPIGGFGDAEVFSLSPTKLLTTGEGGLVATNDQALADQVRLGRNYGDPGTNDSVFSGLNARMSEFHARLGIESLGYLDRNAANRGRLVQLYKTLMSDLPGLSYQTIAKGDQCSYKDFSVMIDKKQFGLDRNQVIAAMAKENITVRKYFHPPVYEQKAFTAYRKKYAGKLAATESVAANIISLPLFSHMTDDEVRIVATAMGRLHAHRADIARL